MRDKTIRIMGEPRRLKQLSCEEALEGETLCARLREELWREDMPEELLDAICEHAVLGYLCLYDGERRVFASARQVLQRLTLEELIRLYDAYALAFLPAEETGCRREISRETTVETGAEER